MPPKKHLKFGYEDEGGRQNGKRTIDEVTNGDASDDLKIPGPLNLKRLKALNDKTEQLSDGDLKFPSSESSESEREHKKKASKKKKKELNNTNTNNKNGNIRKGKTVTYYDSEDEEEGSGQKPVGKQTLKQTKQKLLIDRQQLPIYKARNQVLEHLDRNRVVVLLGETGSGKSTQLPQLILDQNKDAKIAITQPRRVAAINLASRVAEESGSQLGGRVGYSVRFQAQYNPKTQIKYLTDGMLMRELIMDSELSQYSTVILDEAHERTVLTDLLMGLMKRLMRKRLDLKLVVMSATLDADRFAAFFDSAPVVFVEGKTYPVDRLYTRQPLEDVVDGVIRSVVQTNLGQPDGDVLVFLPGQEEIETCVDRLNSLSGDLPKDAPLLVAMPLYASLSPQAQQRAFTKLPQHQRKVILATNIAETSVTIPGVKYVIDSGLRKVKVWKPELGLDTLLTTGISQASAAQRMGRAGRETAGKCFRLFTEDTYKELSKQTEPEILRCDIASTILQLKKAGVDDVVGFDWVERPRKEAIEAALLKLYTLKALDKFGEITNLGRQMVLLPVAPQLAAVLIHSQKESNNLLYQVIDIVSCLSVEDLLVNPHPDQRDEVNDKRNQLFPQGKQHGDLIMLKELYDQYRGLLANKTDKRERREWCKSIAVNPKGMDNVRLVRKQLCQYMKVDAEEQDQVQDLSKVSVEPILKAFLHGYVGNTALGLPDRRFKTITHQQMINIHPSSMMFGQRPEAIMYMEYVFTTKGYARTVSPVEIAWLEEVAPHLLNRKTGAVQ